jgi:hypothetical protein
MGVLVVTCPQTGKKFSTGVLIEQNDLSQIDKIQSRPRFARIAETVMNGVTATPNG